MTLTVYDCRSSQDAAVALWTAAIQLVDHSHYTATELADHSVLLTSAPGQSDPDPVVLNALARGHVFIIAAVWAPAGAPLDRAGIAERTAAAQAELAAGAGWNAHVDLRLRVIESRRFTETLGALILGYLAVIGPWAMLTKPLRGERYGVRSGDPRWTDVTKAAGWLRRWVRLRAAARVGFLLFAIILVSGEVSVGSVVTVVICGVLGWIRPVGRVRGWRPSRVRGLRIFSSWGAWISAPLGAVSLVLLAAAALTVLMPFTALVSGISQSPLFVGGTLDLRYVPTDTSSPVWWSLLPLVLPREYALGVMLAVAIVLVMAATRLRRAGRSLALAARHHLPPPYVLYLRNFGDDRLRMSTSAIGRTSLVERLNPFTRQPFEEVLARHLNRLAPVVTARPPGSRVPTIGAVRMILPDGSAWKDGVAEYAGLASAVVVAATPDAVQPGLRWELSYLDRERATGPVMLVLGPHPRGDLVARWNLFVAAARTYPRFGALDTYLDGGHSGAIVMVLDPAEGWLTWGAEKRNEWTYAVALSHAIDRARAIGPSPDRIGSEGMLAGAPRWPEPY
ncbi:hypothetical protein I6A60_26700 [Frankia sp. AgB1.9]|uniref:hypothetical protein n=1 Tax=unclassified Frankia TaxID=2632575 RepID=UPI0019319039|nr:MULTISPECIES: hypothetical protein [unclassified Frankia]MBL7488601.1 hypothetical protein [Frankia sp. AgW1.1]MBL7551421.1 hypothetical protein [Frankia sp. AgB1.9]MBL7622674.1 hypothetical protein [Frankia sp. AgB1.8]